MKMREYAPSGALAQFIKSYRIIESEGELVNRLLPSTSCTMAFQLKGHVFYGSDAVKTQLPAAMVSGLRKTVRMVKYPAHTAVLVVGFKATGVAGLLRQPVHELFEETLALDNFFTRSEMAIIEEQLAEATHDAARIAALEKFLSARLLKLKNDELVGAAVSRIVDAKGQLRMKELSQSLFISQDAFEKRFRKLTGATPKQFSTIVKMEALIRERMQGASILDLALESGYYDQAHFNKDFKQFTGQTPSEFFKTAVFW